ncbi:MAG: hypothetical protein J6U96_03170 [Elusimicrobiaceae bacterium]|nr:hypothetical protein [Elusimicrobiaceae bacterium]
MKKQLFQLRVIWWANNFPFLGNLAPTCRSPYLSVFDSGNLRRNLTSKMKNHGYWRKFLPVRDTTKIRH